MVSEGRSARGLVQQISTMGQRMFVMSDYERLIATTRIGVALVGLAQLEA
jgi:hypothetical protein